MHFQAGVPSDPVPPARPELGGLGYPDGYLGGLTPDGEVLSSRRGLMGRFQSRRGLDGEVLSPRRGGLKPRRVVDGRVLSPRRGGLKPRRVVDG